MLKKLESSFMTPAWINERDQAKAEYIRGYGAKLTATKMNERGEAVFTEEYKDGLITKTTSHKGDKTDYFYKDGLLITTEFSSAEDGKNSTIEYYYDKNGVMVRSICIETGLVCEYFHNKNGELEIMRSSLPGRKPFNTTYTYDDKGRMVHCVGRKGDTTYVYDDNNLTVTIIKEPMATKGQSAKAEEIIEKYDEYGRIISRKKSKNVTMTYEYSGYIETSETAKFGKTVKPARQTNITVEK